MEACVAAPAEPVAGGSAEETAGRRRLGELHNALCHKVLAVRAGARAAHKSAAGAGADAVDAAAQSFQTHMQVGVVLVTVQCAAWV